VRLVRGIVKDVEEKKIILNDGTEVPYGLLVWSTGVGPSPFIQSLDLPKSPGGRFVYSTLVLHLFSFHGQPLQNLQLAADFYMDTFSIQICIIRKAGSHLSKYIVLLSIVQIYYVLTLKCASIYVQNSLFTGLALMSGFVFLRCKISFQ
jgi:hypothetical protein